MVVKIDGAREQISEEVERRVPWKKYARAGRASLSARRSLSRFYLLSCFLFLALVTWTGYSAWSSYNLDSGAHFSAVEVASFSLLSVESDGRQFSRRNRHSVTAPRARSRSPSCVLADNWKNFFLVQTSNVLAFQEEIPLLLSFGRCPSGAASWLPTRTSPRHQCKLVRSPSTDLTETVSSVLPPLRRCP
jgi:hypothetical protein